MNKKKRSGYKGRTLFSVPVNHPYIKIATGRMVVARSVDDDCWSVFIDDGDELYDPEYDRYETHPASIEFDVECRNSQSAKRLQDYFKSRWNIVLPIRYGKAHIDRFWDARSRKQREAEQQ